MNPAQEKYDKLRSLCIGCEKCLKVCPSHRYGGCNPVEVSSGELKAVFDCVGCGMCERVCEHTHPKEMMMAAYTIILNRNIDPAFDEIGLARYPSADAPGIDLEPVWTGDDVYVMPGCTAKCDVPYIIYATSAALKGLGMKAKEIPKMTCCMYPVQFGILTDEVRRSYRQRMCERTGDRDLVMLCPGCAEITKKDGSECEHIIEYLHRFIDRLPVIDHRIKVSVEPGCAALDHFDKMCDIVTAMGLEWVGNTPGCCGKRARRVASPMMSERQKAAEGADLIIVGCPMCMNRYDSVTDGIPAMYITELVAMGFDDTTSLDYHKLPIDRKQMIVKKTDDN